MIDLTLYFTVRCPVCGYLSRGREFTTATVLVKTLRTSFGVVAVDPCAECGRQPRAEEMRAARLRLAPEDAERVEVERERLRHRRRASYERRKAAA